MAFFCYLDSISEAQRVKGWPGCDITNFVSGRLFGRQLRWDHKDISLWMKLMTQARRTAPPYFQDGAGGGTTLTPSATKRKGICWQFNDGTCRFGSSCWPWHLFLKHAAGSVLSRFKFSSVFKKCLQSAGFQVTEYSLYSFRIGAATEVARWGLNDKALQRIGMWESLHFHL